MISARQLGTRIAVGLGIFALIFGTVFLAGLASESVKDYQVNQREQELRATLDQAQTLNILLATRIDGFAADYNLSAEDMALFGNALALARPCTEMGNCGMFQEWRDSSDYHTVPYAALVSTSPTSSYYVVPVEVQYVRNAGDYYNPRLVVYHMSRGGTITRVAEDSSVSQHWCDGWDCGWHPIDDPGYATRIRHNVLHALSGG